MAEPAGATQSVQMFAVQQNNSELRYVGWMHTAFLYLVSFFVSTYKKVRDGSGPLKFGFQFVENIFTYIFGLDLIIQFLSHLTFMVFKFLDGLVKWIDQNLVPSLVHEAVQVLFLFLQALPEVVQYINSEIKRVGVIAEAKNISDELIVNSYNVLTEQFYIQLVKVMVAKWKRLNEFKLFRKLAQVIVPMISYCCVKYNECLVFCQKNGYKGFGYLPLIPMEKISQTFTIAQ